MSTCLSCANLDLKSNPGHTKVGLGACLAAKFSGKFRSFSKERNCSMFVPAAKDVVEARMVWADKQKSKSTNEGEKKMQKQYDINNLLDTIQDALSLKNDAALARALEVAPPVISKLRRHRLPVGASMLVRMHEISRLEIAELRGLMGDTRPKFGASTAELMGAA